jgi:HPt (histidine-containing phosphotransfer) domain-containing protein
MDDYLSKPISSSELNRVLALFNPESNATEKVAHAVSNPGPSSFRDADVGGFDYARALGLADQEVIEIITDIFVAQWPVDLAKMTQALAQSDGTSLAHCAHALKGILGMFGAHPAVELAGELEQLASRLDGPNADAESEAALASILALTSQVDYLLIALKQRQSVVVK